MKLTYSIDCTVANFFLDLAKEYLHTKDDPIILKTISNLVNESVFEKPVDACREYTKIVAVEGINGSLKSTLLKRLTSLNSKAKSLRYRPDEINDCHLLNSQVNRYLTDIKAKKESFVDTNDLSLTAQTLLIASYEAFVWERLAQNPKILCRSDNILINRMHDSSITIQTYLLTTKGVKTEEAMEFMIDIYRKFGQPSTNLLLDFPVESCIKRIESRKKDDNSNRNRKELTEHNILFELHRLQQELVKKNPNNYLSINHPDIKIYWEDKPDTDYDLDGICRAIIDRVII